MYFCSINVKSCNFLWAGTNGVIDRTPGLVYKRWPIRRFYIPYNGIRPNDRMIVIRKRLNWINQGSVIMIVVLMAPEACPE
jgi:hypothetical protein